MQLLCQEWDGERVGLFEPIPFKGDENMTVETKNRAALDEDEGDNQLLISTGETPKDNAKKDS